MKTDVTKIVCCIILIAGSFIGADFISSKNSNSSLISEELDRQIESVIVGSEHILNMVHGSTVRIYGILDNIEMNCSGTIIKHEKLNDKLKLTILGSGHCVNNNFNYRAIYQKQHHGNFIKYLEFDIKIKYVDYISDLAIFEGECLAEDIDNLTVAKLYNGTDNLFGKRVLISSYPFELGPVFGYGYINRIFINGDTEYIAAYIIADKGSSGASIKCIKDGSIIGVISTCLGDQDGRIQYEMNCIKYTTIKKFLDKNNISL